MTESRFLSNDEFAFIVRHIPLVSFDIIIKDPEGNVLVGLRTNEPAKGKYFVPGGIIRKNETLANAFARILQSEIGLKASLSEAKFVGVYEHLYGLMSDIAPLPRRAMYGRRPRCKRNLTFCEAFGCSHVSGLFSNGRVTSISMQPLWPLALM